MKPLIITLTTVFLMGCSNLGDTSVTRSGDNTGLKSWEVNQVFKWGKGEK